MTDPRTRVERALARQAAEEAEAEGFAERVESGEVTVDELRTYLKRKQDR